nr:hypothetical protein [Tanacetum cinerariifolium]
MDICNKIRLSKGDTLPKKSSLSDSDQIKHRNKLPGVKGIDRISPMKSKIKVFNPQPVCQYNPTIGEVIKESDKVPVVKEKPVDVIEKSTVVKESDKAPVVAAAVSEKSVVDEKDNPKVTSKVSKGKSLDVFKYKRKTELHRDNKKDNPKDKESDKASVVAAVDEKDNRKVMSKVSDESDKATVVAPVLKEKPANVIEKSTVFKESDKATVVAPVLKEKPANVIEKSTVFKESDKAPVVKESNKVPVVKESDKAPVVAPGGVNDLRF